MWCIKGSDSPILVDTGMTDEVIKKKPMLKIASPKALLNKIGVNPRDIKIVIISHLHDDHASEYALYPNATFYIQKKEIEFWTGPILSLSPCALPRAICLKW